MSIYSIIVICGTILFLGFCVLLCYLAKLDSKIEIELIKASIKEKEFKTKYSTIFLWIFILSAFGIIWISEYRIELIGTLILSFIFSYLALKGEKNKNE